MISDHNEPCGGYIYMQTLIQRYGKKRVWTVIGCAWAVIILVGVVKATTGDDSGSGIDRSSAAFKAGQTDAGKWSFVYEDADTALNDCEAGVAHDGVLGQLDEKTIYYSDQQLVEWSAGCVDGLRNFGMYIPKQPWE
ncbi:hypothetical protein [Streptomyces sp. NPDC051452]|uniref:hypothetical protein n=1 Tax=Streptomyces sp. NPDC051452 TaxID=3365654 RepID=UPI0037B98DFF